MFFGANTGQKGNDLLWSLFKPKKWLDGVYVNNLPILIFLTEFLLVKVIKIDKSKTCVENIFEFSRYVITVIQILIFGAKIKTI